MHNLVIIRFDGWWVLDHVVNPRESSLMWHTPYDISLLVISPILLHYDICIPP
jgi:hypothetical protein